MSDRLRGIQEELEDSLKIKDGVIEELLAGDFLENLCNFPLDAKINVYGSEFNFKDSDMDKPLYDPVLEKVYIIFQKIPQLREIEVYDDGGQMQKLEYNPEGELRKNIHFEFVFDKVIKQKQE